MRRRLPKSFGFLLVVSIAVLSCTLPSEVDVKTDAEYNVCIGSFSPDLSSLLSTDEIGNGIRSGLASDNSTAVPKLYDYVPNSADSTLTYLLNYPVYNVDLDLSGYLDGIDFGGVFSTGAGPAAVEFTLPTMNLTETTEVPIPSGAN